MDFRYQSVANGSVQRLGGMRDHQKTREGGHRSLRVIAQDKNVYTDNRQSGRLHRRTKALGFIQKRGHGIFAAQDGVLKQLCMAASYASESAVAALSDTLSSINPLLSTSKEMTLVRS
jgi:hypothetical protein